MAHARSNCFLRKTRKTRKTQKTQKTRKTQKTDEKLNTENGSPRKLAGRRFPVEKIHTFFFIFFFVGTTGEFLKGQSLMDDSCLNFLFSPLVS